MLVRIAPLRIALAAALLSLPLSAQVATWEVSTSPNPSYPANPFELFLTPSTEILSAPPHVNTSAAAIGHVPRLPQVAIQQDGATLSPGSVCVDFVHYGSNPSFNGTLSVGTVPGTTPLVTNYLRLPPTAHVEHVAYFQVPPVPIPGATYFAETYTSPAGHQPIVVPNNPALIGGEVFVQPVAVVLDTLANESFVVFDKATRSVIGTSQPTF